jgi:O-succinylbenzoate synthase
MKIQAIQVLPGDAQRRSVIVRIVSASESGVSEATAAEKPLQSEQWTGGTIAFVEQCLVPELIDHDISTAAALAEIMAKFRGYSLAKGAVDCAWHDLAARLAGVPLWQLLGGKPKPVAVSYPFARRASIDELLTELAVAVNEGVTEATLKLRPGWGIDVVRAVRGTFPALTIRVDFDGTASLDQRDLLFRLQDYQVAAIEQPLDADDLIGHAMLQESLRTPVCLDQSITSVERARQALEMGSCQQIRIAPDLCGGMFAAKGIIAVCREAGATCLIGARSQSETSMRQAAAVAMLEHLLPSIEVEVDRKSTDAELHKTLIAPWQESGNGLAPTDAI